MVLVRACSHRESPAQLPVLFEPFVSSALLGASLLLPLPSLLWAWLGIFTCALTLVSVSVRCLQSC